MAIGAVDVASAAIGTVEGAKKITPRTEQTSKISKLANILYWPTEKWAAIKGIVTAPAARVIVGAGKRIPFLNQRHQRKCEELADKWVNLAVEKTSLPVTKIEKAAKEAISAVASGIAKTEAGQKISKAVQWIKTSKFVLSIANYLVNCRWWILIAIGRFLGGVRQLPATVEETLDKHLDIKKLVSRELLVPLINLIEQKAAETAIQTGLDYAVDFGLGYFVAPVIVAEATRIMELGSTASTVLSTGVMTYAYGPMAYNAGRLVYNSYYFKKNMENIDKALSKVELAPLINKLNLQHIPEAMARHAIKAILLGAVESGIFTRAFGYVDFSNEDALTAFFNKSVDFLNQNL